MGHRRSRVLIAGLLTIVLFATPNAAPDDRASAAQPVAQPALQPLGGAFIPLPANLEPKAKLTLNPAADTVVVSFGKAYRHRVATLQQRDEMVEAGGTTSEWVKAAGRKKLDSKGRATFKLDVVGGYSYQVSLSRSGSRPARVSPAVALGDQWDSDVSDQFDADAIDDTLWSDRFVGDQVRSRLCSLPSDNHKLRFVDNGEFTAGIIKHTDDKFFDDVVARVNPIADAKLELELAAARHLRTKRKREDAIAVAKYHFKTTYNCPQGAFENAMVSTRDNQAGLRVNTAKPGIVAARMKFPTAQGMHSAMWLQSYVPGGAEIDIVESFGYGDGLINLIHVPSTGKMYKPGNPVALKKKGGHILQSKARSRTWWEDYHEVSVEWTATKFVFRVDGAVTKTIKLKPGKADYYLILSLLSSDWELPRLAHPIGKVAPVTDVSDQKFLVDWVHIWSKHS